MSDIENEEIQESGEKLAPPPGSDYEVPYTFHSETPLERSYDKADHWVIQIRFIWMTVSLVLSISARK